MKEKWSLNFTKNDKAESGKSEVWIEEKEK